MLPIDAGKRNNAKVEIGFGTHMGSVRRENEDRYFVAPEFGVFAVADGMGGHEEGALASAIVVEALGSIGAAVSAPDLLARLEDRVLRANAKLCAAGRTRGGVVGSTLAVLLTFDDRFACVWSGDSRIYLLRDGGLTQLSRDHTEARNLVEKGILTVEEARVWPRRNVITRALGARPEPELELEHGLLVSGDTFVICTDGLTAHVEDAEIRSIGERLAPQGACDALIALTLDRGASDNVTVVIMRSGTITTTSDPTVVLPAMLRDGGEP